MKKNFRWIATETKNGWKIALCLGSELIFPIGGLTITNDKRSRKCSRARR